LSQEYTEDKEVTLKKLSNSRRILEAVLVLVAIFAIYLMAALVSFNPSDPSWSQTAWHGPIHNLGGAVGAWMADTLLFIFGVLAFAIPVIMLCLCWAAYHQRDNDEYIDYFSLSLRLIGTAALIMTSCGLAALNVDDLYYFASGGVLGSLIATAITPWFNHAGATLLLLCTWAAGLTLFTGWSWLTIAEKIGSIFLGASTVVANHSRKDEVDDDFDDDEESVEQAEQQRTDQPSQPPVGLPHDAQLPPVATATQVRTTEKLAAAATADDDDPLFSVPSVNQLIGKVAMPEQSSVAAVAAPEVPAEVIPPVAAQASGEILSAQVHAESQSEAEQPLFSAHSLNMSMPDLAPMAQDVLEQRLAAWRQQSSKPDPSVTETDDAMSDVAVSESPSIRQDGEENTVLWQTQPSLGVYSHDSNPAVIADHPSLLQVPPVKPAYHADASINAIPVFDAQPAIAHETIEPKPLVATEVQASQVLVPPPVADTPQTEPLQGAPVHTFTPVFSATGNENVQVKKGLGPELPRPKPVRLPTRRELASYGIKLPSQRLAEQQQKEALKAQQQAQQLAGLDDEQISQLEQNQLREAFLAQQQQRYAEPFASDEEDEDADLLAQQQALAQQFAERELQRYQEVAPAEDFSAADAFARAAIGNGKREDFSFEPLAELLEEQSSEPLFTLSPVVEDKPIMVQSPARLATAVEPVVEKAKESLIHPFLMRDEKPLNRPTTPLPSLDLLTSPPAEEEPIDLFALEQTSQLIEARLNDYRIKATVVGKSPGPVITRYELDLAPGVKAARISNLSRDLARSLSAVAVRVVEVIPGKPYVGLELPNKKRHTVYLREVLDCAKFKESQSPLTIVLGKDISGDPVIADLAKMPHLLVAGTTGSGKSVGVNAMILSMLYKASPKDVRFIMIDPKMLELSVYEGIPHLLTEVVTDMKDAANALRWCVAEMERRYKLMSALGVRNLSGYNERVAQAEAMGRPIPDPFWKPSDGMGTTIPELQKEPYIVVMVDEFADLMMTVGKKVEELIARLAQKARAAGIHLVLATQRPSVDVITGLIKANIPTRIAFTVSSKIDSRTILDQGGAESLLGMGDMLYMAPNSSIPVRVHGAFVRDQEVHAVVQDWKARGRPQYVEGILSSGDDGEGNSLSLDGDEVLDPLFDQAVSFVVDKRRASISGVQRQFRIGYNRAARIVEQMEAQGIVSTPGHNGNREVLAPPQQD